MGKINVAIIGVGNCASSLVQGVHYYKKVKENEFVPGLMHANLGAPKRHSWYQKVRSLNGLDSLN